MRHIVSLYNKVKQEKLIAALGVFCWLLLFWVTVSKTYAAVVRNDIPMSMDFIFFEALTIWGLVALFVPAFIWLAKSKPIEGKEKFKNAGIHISISLFLVLLHAFLFEVIINLADHLSLFNGNADDMPFNWGTWHSYLGSIIWMGLVVLFAYWLVVGVWHIKKYYESYKERQLKNIALKAELSNIRLQVLNSQLHPHFLFNTLHNVHTLIHDDAEKAEKMLTLLKRFLQISIQQVNDQQVLLSEEMEFTDIYLKIEQTRFSNRLSVKKEVEPDTLAIKVPNLILQPLVENAVKHGISKKLKSGIIKISSKKTDGVLCLAVEDDGPGFNGKISLNGGKGLKNIKQRLELLYDEPVFELGSSVLGGFKVLIKIPLKQEVLQPV